MLLYKDKVIKKKIDFSSIILKERSIDITSISDVSLLKELYDLDFILDNYLFQDILYRIIVLKDKNIIKYITDCGYDNFNWSRYCKYLNFRKENKSDSFSESFFYLKYGKNFMQHFNKRKSNKNSMYNLKYVMEKYSLNESEAILKIDEYKKTTSGNINRYIKKYGYELGVIKYNEFCNKSKANIENYIRIYGEDIGLDKYKERNKNNSFSKTLDGYKKKYGDINGENLYKTNNKKRSFANTLNGYVDRYGEIDGLKKYKENNLKKIVNVNTYLKKYGINGYEEYKKLCDKKRINKQHFIEKYGDEKGEIEYQKNIIKKYTPISMASKESLDIIFKDLYNYLLESGYSDSDIYIGYNNKKEYFLFDKDTKKIYFYDFTILSKKIIIEYNGIKFHPNPNSLSKKDWDNWRCLYSNLDANTCHKKDLLKEKLALDNGFKYIVIWSDEDNKNILNRIKEELKL